MCREVRCAVRPAMNRVYDLLLLLLLVPRAVSGAPARLRINELNANIAIQCDLVELRVVACGNMDGVQLWTRTTPALTFAPFEVPTESFIVVHLNGSSSTCNLGPSSDETTSPIQNPASI